MPNLAAIVDALTSLAGPLFAQVGRRAPHFNPLARALGMLAIFYVVWRFQRRWSGARPSPGRPRHEPERPDPKSDPLWDPSVDQWPGPRS
jgi:hypothetical protein